MLYTKCTQNIAAFVLITSVLVMPAFGLSIQSFSLTGTTIGLYEPLFINFGLDQSFSNPFDPRQIDVTCEFTGPSGITRTIPAFYAADYPGWEARIAPLEIGTHNCRIVARNAAGNTATRDFTFNAVTSNSRGFVRIDERNPEYMRFDDGTPYFPVGMNACWGVPGPFFNKMGAVGVNWTRFWLSTGDVEWNGSGGTLGVYDQTQQINDFETIIASARNNGLYMQMCTDSFTEWNVHSFDEWHVNPYNNDNGGMLENPIDYFYNAEALRLAKQRYRYIVARWAYSPNILCWEFWNEVDAVGWGQDWSLSFWSHVDAVLNWHSVMGAYVRSIDPFEHLRTTSFANTGTWVDQYNRFWALDEMDIVQAHRYSPIVPNDHIATLYHYDDHDKPVILGETGLANTPPTDSSGIYLHDMIWPLAVCQSGAMSWWWDNWIDKYNLYYRFTPLLAFLDGEDFAPQYLAPGNFTRLGGPTNMSIWGSSGASSAYLWLLYYEGNVSGASIRVNSIVPGSYVVEYWSTGSGTMTSQTTVTATSQGATLNIPTFHRNVAIKVKPLAPSMVVAPTRLDPEVYVGLNPPGDQLELENLGYGSFSYAITDNVGWLSVTPTGGTVTGETDAINVSYSTSELLPGIHNAVITITSAEAANSPLAIPVTLTVNSHPADGDADGDVDQSDFGLLQACFSGNGIPYDEPECEQFDLDTDDDIDWADRQALEACFSGPGFPADVACLHQ